MKLGFVTAIFPEFTLDQILGLAAAERFACVEAMCWPVGKAERKYAGVTHVEVSRFSSAQADEINGLCARHGVQLSALGYYPNALDPDPEAAMKSVSHLKKVMLAAEKLRLNRVTTFVGHDWRISVDDVWPRFLRTWKPLVSFAEDHGVRLAIENCPMLYTRDEWPGGKNLAYSPAIWRRMFNDIPSKNFGLNYDPSHLVWMRMDWLAPLREFRDKLFHVHAKDVTIDSDRLNRVGILAAPLQFHQPRIPGFGEIDWGRFFATLTRVGYHGPVCIEVEDETFGKSMPGRKRALRLARNHVEPFFA